MYSNDDQTLKGGMATACFKVKNRNMIPVETRYNKIWYNKKQNLN